jgi:phosphatidylethanolamine-binding protein
MADLDAPSASNSSLSPLIHWLVQLPRDTTTTISINDSIVSYGRPSPPPGSGRHRYTLLLLSSPQPTFSWPEGAREIRANVSTDRLGYDIEGFVRAGGYEVVAGNYFTTDNTTAAVPTATPSPTAVPAGAASVMAGSAVWGVGGVVALALAYL